MNHVKQNARKTCGTCKSRRRVIDHTSELKEVHVEVFACNQAPFVTKAEDHSKVV